MGFDYLTIRKAIALVACLMLLIIFILHHMRQ